MIFFCILLAFIFLSVGMLLSMFGTRDRSASGSLDCAASGTFQTTAGTSLNWIIRTIDHVAYRHSLKEEAIDVLEQTAITQDNVSVILDGVVYVKIVDPVAASYGVKDPLHALTQLVQDNRAFLGLEHFLWTKRLKKESPSTLRSLSPSMRPRFPGASVAFATKSRT